MKLGATKAKWRILLACGCGMTIPLGVLDTRGQEDGADSVLDDLARAATDLVLEQVNKASQGHGTIWASQPGAVSVFSNDSVGGLPSKIHKLYSARRMNADSFSQLGEDTPPSPNDLVGFVDLNAPIGEGNNVRFPIVDPRLLENPPEGFGVEEGHGVDGGDRLPMYVKWFYVGENGRFSVEQSEGEFVDVDGRSFGRTGRIAFWTDDESSKINVNTSSEGVFWDTPRADSVEERHYAEFQPAWGEYQRAPGHPAMTSLSS